MRRAEHKKAYTECVRREKKKRKRTYMCESLKKNAKDKPENNELVTYMGEAGGTEGERCRRGQTSLSIPFCILLAVRSVSVLRIFEN